MPTPKQFAGKSRQVRISTKQKTDKSASPQHVEILVIPSFHWDRAWYESFQKFRIRLVDAMDKLLDIMERRQEYKFTLDGQTVILEDYLEIRPEKIKTLKKLISEGRIAVGPWYVLPDEKIPSEESHIRNLLTGHRIAKTFGRVMKVGYTPDAFGHISQLPQLLRGFKIKSAFFSRGIPDGMYNTEFLWQSPDVYSSVVVYYTNYGNAYKLGTAEEFGMDATPVPCIRDYLKEKVKEIAGKSATGIIALMANMDHLEPQKKVIDIVKLAMVHHDLHHRVAGRSTPEKGMNIKIATVDELMAKVAKRTLKQKHYGECPPPVANFRNGFLPGVLSTRTYLKQANNNTERTVLLAEHLCTIAEELGYNYPASSFRMAWKYILRSQPHDDCCGCSRDVVHRDDMYRLEQAREIANGLIYRSLDDPHPRAFEQIVSKIDTTSFSENQKGLVVYNRLGWAVSGLVHMDATSVPCIRDVLETGLENKPGFHLIDEQGNQISPAKGGASETIEFLTTNVPSCGYITYRINVETSRRDGMSPLVTVEGSRMENKFLKVSINEDGSLNIHDKTSGETYNNCNIFIEDEDAGDTYNHSRCEYPQQFISTSFKPEIKLEKNTGLSATFFVKYLMEVPESLTADRKSRSNKLVILQITSKITLEAESKVLKFETTINNTVKDHRISVKFPIGIKTDTSYAEGHFDIMKRPTELPEEIYHRFNVRNYITVHKGNRGVTLIPAGLCEYEATKDTEGNVDLYLTLLRGVGYLSHESLQARLAGPVIETPEAQCSGIQTFKYAIICHTEKSFLRGDCYKAAYEHNNELITYLISLPTKALAQAGKHNGGSPRPSPRSGCLPQTYSFVKIPEGLILSSLKQGEESPDHTYVRVWNPGNKPVKGTLIYFKNLRAAYKTGLDEKRRAKLGQLDKNSVELSVAPKQILTIELVSVNNS